MSSFAQLIVVEEGVSLEGEFTHLVFLAFVDGQFDGHLVGGEFLEFDILQLEIDVAEVVIEFGEAFLVVLKFLFLEIRRCR